MAQLTREQVEAGRAESAGAMRALQESIDLEWDEHSEITVKVEATNGNPNSIGGLVAKIVAAVIAIGAAAEAVRQALGK